MKRNDRIRQIAVYAAYIIFFTTLQVSFPDNFSLRNQTADFMLVLVVLSGYFFKTIDGAVVGLTVGLIRDVLAGMTLGVGALLFFFIGILSSVFFSKAFHSRASLAILQIALMTLGYKIIGHLWFYFMPILERHDTTYLSFQNVVFDSILPQLGVNLLIAIPMIFLIKYVGPYRVGYVKPEESARITTEGLWRKG
jgi:rod shape-determining protein MreD